MLLIISEKLLVRTLLYIVFYSVFYIS